MTKSNWNTVGAFQQNTAILWQILSLQFEGEHTSTCATKKYQLLHCCCCENGDPNQFLIKVAIVSLVLFIHGAI
jgi:hypothetical protein